MAPEGRAPRPGHPPQPPRPGWLLRLGDARQGTAAEFAEGCGPAGHWPQGKAPQSMGVGFIRALLSRAVLSSYASVLTNDAQLHASVCTGVHT